MKPAEQPDPSDRSKLVAVEHPVFKAGWASGDAFKVISYTTPVRYAGHLSDIRVSAGRAPMLAAVASAAQGTAEASGVFRSGPTERPDFCRDYEGAADTAGYRACLAEPAETMTAKADCEAKRITLDGRGYALAPGNRVGKTTRLANRFRKMDRNIKLLTWLQRARGP